MTFPLFGPSGSLFGLSAFSISERPGIPGLLKGVVGGASGSIVQKPASRARSLLGCPAPSMEQEEDKMVASQRFSSVAGFKNKFSSRGRIS